MSGELGSFTLSFKIIISEKAKEDVLSKGK